MTHGPELSPTMLDERRGVRRLNRVPLFIAGAMLLLILAAVTYTYQIRLAEMRRTATEAHIKPEAANPSSLFRDAPDGGFIPANSPEAASPPSPIAVPPTEKPLAPIGERDPYAEAWERYTQEQERLAQQRNLRMLQAIGAPTRIQGGATPKTAAARPDAGEARDAPQAQASAANSPPSMPPKRPGSAGLSRASQMRISTAPPKSAPSSPIANPRPAPQIILPAAAKPRSRPTRSRLER